MPTIGSPDPCAGLEVFDIGLTNGCLSLGDLLTWNPLAWPDVSLLPDLPLRPAWESSLEDRSAVVLADGDLDVVEDLLGPWRDGA